MRVLAAVPLALVLLNVECLAWDGVDTQTGESVEIGKGNLVRRGEDIEIYNYGSGEYRDMSVESIERSGSDVEIELYDNQTGETHTYEFEGD